MPNLARNLNVFNTRKQIKEVVTRLDAGFVYFIQNIETKDVKIGNTTNIRERFIELQIANSKPLIINFALLTCGKSMIEKTLHEKMAKFRLRGEWFKSDILREVHVKSDSADFVIDILDATYDIYSKYALGTLLELGSEEEIITCYDFFTPAYKSYICKDIKTYILEQKLVPKYYNQRIYGC